MKKPVVTHKRRARRVAGPKGEKGAEVKREGGNEPARVGHGGTIHNGSAGAFDATEHSHDEDEEDQDNDDFAMDR